MLAFLTDYVIFESDEIAYQVIVGIKELTNVLLYLVRCCYAKGATNR